MYDYSNLPMFLTYFYDLCFDDQYSKCILLKSNHHYSKMVFGSVQLSDICFESFSRNNRNNISFFLYCDCIPFKCSMKPLLSSISLVLIK